jgi:hypothetical protein
MTELKSAAKPLRLLAQDHEDLQVISAALQDAIAHVGDIRYEPVARRLTVLFNRYRWEACPNGDCERVVAALQFGDVSRLRHKGLRSDDKGALVSVLALAFHPDEPPGGVVLLHFADGLELRLEVDCIDAVLADVSDPWPASREPVHLDAEDEVSDEQTSEAQIQGEDA